MIHIHILNNLLLILFLSKNSMYSPSRKHPANLLHANKKAISLSSSSQSSVKNPIRIVVPESSKVDSPDKDESERTNSSISPSTWTSAVWSPFCDFLRLAFEGALRQEWFHLLVEVEQRAIRTTFLLH
uniref:Uncharacterized protein n=1 Tax=Physcomitrium patens TaxID=3218 RepID=A0A2K1J5C8_PHYPA|nr:hypothetical protein PHYPA_022569 [Physcomitrium patens]